MPHRPISRTEIDMATWPRREHYAVFGNMPDPFFGLTTRVDFTECHRQAKADGASFFLYSLHLAMMALNAVPELRCRIEDDRIFRYDTIDASSTVGRDDGSFGFGYFPFDTDRAAFVRNAMEEVRRVKAEKTGLSMNGNEGRKDLFYFTSVPWVDFTQIKHAGGDRPGDSIPRIAMGKLVDDGNGRLSMAVSLEANHGLADGRHAAMFFEALAAGQAR